MSNTKHSRTRVRLPFSILALSLAFGGSFASASTLANQGASSSTPASMNATEWPSGFPGPRSVLRIVDHAKLKQRFAETLPRQPWQVDVLSSVLDSTGNTVLETGLCFDSEPAEDVELALRLGRQRLRLSN